MKVKVANPTPNTFAPQTLLANKSGTRIVICTKDINELTFSGIILYDDVSTSYIGVCDTWAKSAYSLFTGEITLSN